MNISSNTSVRFISLLIIIFFLPLKAVNIKLISSDDQEFEIPEELAQKSQTLKDLIEDLGTNAQIPLPVINGKTLGKIIDILKALAESKNVEDYIPAKLSDDNLKDLLEGMHYLNIFKAEAITAQIIAEQLKNNKDYLISNEFKKFTGIPEIEKLILEKLNLTKKMVEPVKIPEQLSKDILHFKIHENILVAINKNSTIFLFRVDKNGNITSQKTISEKKFDTRDQKQIQLFLTDYYLAVCDNITIAIWDIRNLNIQQIANIDISSVRHSAKNICINNNLLIMTSMYSGNVKLFLWKIIGVKVEKIENEYEFPAVNSYVFILPYRYQSFLLMFSFYGSKKSSFIELIYKDMINKLEITNVNSYKQHIFGVNPFDKNLFILNNPSLHTIELVNPETLTDTPNDMINLKKIDPDFLASSLATFDKNIAVSNIANHMLYVFIKPFEQRSPTKEYFSFAIPEYAWPSLLMGKNIIAYLTKNHEFKMWKFFDDTLEKALQSYWKMSDEELAEARKIAAASTTAKKPTSAPTKPAVPPKPSYIKSDLSFALNQLSKNLNGLAAAIKK